MNTMIDTPNGIAYARLAALKGRVKLESVGLKFRGPSTRKFMALEMGLKATAKHADVIAAIQAKMNELLENR